MPAAYLPDRFGRPNNSWRMAMLPYMEQTSTFNNVNYSFSWDASENSTAINQLTTLPIQTFTRKVTARPGIRPIMARVGLPHF